MVSPQDALNEHNPRPVGDPAYVPYWAKGEFARINGTRWAFPDGTQVAGGVITRKGHGRLSECAELSKYRPQAESGLETPRRASAVPPKAPRTPDRAQALWAECNGRSEKVAMLRRYNIDPTLLDNAPNPGVATMRALNALRRVLG